MKLFRDLVVLLVFIYFDDCAIYVWVLRFGFFGFDFADIDSFDFVDWFSVYLWDGLVCCSLLLYCLFVVFDGCYLCVVGFNNILDVLYLGVLLCFTFGVLELYADYLLMMFVDDCVRLFVVLLFDCLIGGLDLRLFCFDVFW